MQNKGRFPVLALAGYFKAERLVGEACEDLSRREGTNGLFFTHSDHLGSSSWTTDADGRAVQHIEYLPFGEELLNQRATSYSERYTFTGKELDEESNLYYYDARYNSSTYSQFITVDPMSDKYPSVNPYLYCAGNPIKYVDPDGMKIYKNAQELYAIGMQAINKKEFKPGYNGCTHCNQAAQYINGNDKSLTGNANQMGYKLQDKNFATKISSEDAQTYANQGVTVFASFVDKTGGHGHIAVVAPGEMKYSATAGEKVVNIFNVGAKNGLMTVSKGFGNLNVEYFILNTDLENINTYNCGRLQEITIEGKAIECGPHKSYVIVPPLEKPNVNELLQSIK